MTTMRQRTRTKQQTPRNTHPYCSAAGCSGDPAIWEQTLGREISEARAACLQGLRRIPTGLGRLAYLAILQHRLLEDHEELFGEFCNYSLQQKYEWLFRLLASASHDGALPDGWLKRSAYSDLVPLSAEKTAKKAYLTDIEATLEILRTELEGGSGGAIPNSDCTPKESSGSQARQASSGI